MTSGGFTVAGDAINGFANRLSGRGDAVNTAAQTLGAIEVGADMFGSTAHEQGFTAAMAQTVQRITDLLSQSATAIHEAADGTKETAAEYAATEEQTATGFDGMNGGPMYNGPTVPGGGAYGSYPTQGPDSTGGGMPMMPGGGSFAPTDPMDSGIPVMPGGGGFGPPDPMGGGIPVMPGGSGFGPVDPMSGGIPVVPGGRFAPVDPMSGGMPVVPGGGFAPTDPMGGGGSPLNPLTAGGMPPMPPVDPLSTSGMPMGPPGSMPELPGAPLMPTLSGGGSPPGYSPVMPEIPSISSHPDSTNPSATTHNLAPSHNGTAPSSASMPQFTPPKTQLPSLPSLPPLPQGPQTPSTFIKPTTSSLPGGRPPVTETSTSASRSWTPPNISTPTLPDYGGGPGVDSHTVTYPTAAGSPQHVTGDLLGGGGPGGGGGIPGGGGGGSSPGGDNGAQPISAPSYTGAAPMTSPGVVTPGGVPGGAPPGPGAAAPMGGGMGGMGGGSGKDGEQNRKSAAYIKGEEVFKPQEGHLPPSVIGAELAKPRPAPPPAPAAN